MSRAAARRDDPGRRPRSPATPGTTGWPARRVRPVAYNRLSAAVMVAALVAGGCSDPAEPVTAPTATPVADRWNQRTSAPVERTEVAAGVLAGRIWVLGGFAGDGTVRTEVVVYDPATDGWASGPALPEGLHHPSAAGDGTRLWVAGGYVTDGSTMRPTSAVRMIDGPSGTWRDGPALPEPRAAGALAWDGTRLVYGGGVGPNGLAGDVFVLEGQSWRRIGALATAREHLAAAADQDGNTWFLAGRLGGLDTNRSDVDLVTGDQVRRIGAVPTPRGGVAGFHVPRLGGCVAGGEEPSGTLHEVECVSSAGVGSTLPNLATARHGVGAVVVDGVAYLLLGGPKPGLTVSSTVQALRVG